MYPFLSESIYHFGVKLLVLPYVSISRLLASYIAISSEFTYNPCVFYLVCLLYSVFYLQPTFFFSFLKNKNQVLSEIFQEVFDEGVKLPSDAIVQVWKTVGAEDMIRVSKTISGQDFLALPSVS